MSLTDVTIRKANPGEKPIKLSDEKGLYLDRPKRGQVVEVVALQISLRGQGEALSLGVYPDVSLKDARDRRDAARKLVAEGVDPSENRKAQKAAKADRAEKSFEVVMREWFAKYSSTWVDYHGDRILKRFARDIFPWIGARPVAEITAQELLAVIRRIETRGAVETSHRALSNCGQVFRYAVATGRAEREGHLVLTT